MIRARIAVLLVALIALVAFAQAPGAQQPCAVIARAVIHTYDGPIVIDQLCMTVNRYSAQPTNAIEFEAVDLGSGIFRDGFDGPNL